VGLYPLLPPSIFNNFNKSVRLYTLLHLFPTVYWVAVQVPAESLCRHRRSIIQAQRLGISSGLPLMR